MNRYAAWRRCQELWRRLGLPFTRIRRKSVVDRYEVGYLANGDAYIMGAGPTWEAAFERAAKEGK